MTRSALVAVACAGLTVTAAATALALRRRIAVVTVRGLSMQPTLNAGDRLLIRRVAAGQLRTGQIVVIERPGRDGGAGEDGLPSWPPAGQDWLIKRLAALPGDPTPTVVLAAAPPGAGPVVPAGQLVVLGDNPGCSQDSRELGCIAADRVLGVVVRALPG